MRHPIVTIRAARRSGRTARASLALVTGLVLSLAVAPPAVAAPSITAPSITAPSMPSLTAQTAALRDGNADSATTEIDATATESAIVHGTSVVVRYTVTDAGQPIPGAHTEVQYGGKTTPIVLDATGRGAINIRDLPVGAPAVIIRYAGDATHAAASTTLTFSVAARATTVAGLAMSPSVVTAGTASMLRFMVKSEGKPLPGARVAITYRGTTVWAVSGKDGRVARTITGLPVGTTSVLVRYFGGPGYARASATTSISVTSPCPATARACIDLTNDLTWIQDGGKITYGPVPITSGRAGYRTRPGTFTVFWKNLHHRSSIFNGAPMPYSIFFDGGIAFHEGSLSIPSHGCIHLSRAAAQTFWANVHVGDQVFVWGSAPY